MTEKHYIVFEETNDHEGETWYFYIPFNEEALELLTTFVNSIDEECGYDVWEDEYDEKTLRKLPSHTNYMSEHNILKEFDIEHMKNFFNSKENEEICDILYKGGIETFQIGEN